MKRLHDVHFSDLLPESIKHDPSISAAAKSLDPLFKKTTLAIPNLLIWARLERENAALMKPLARLVAAAGGLSPHSLEALELLAWQLHVDFRDLATTPAMLERMVRESIPWHRIKGTPAAVERALAMYGIEALTDECGRGQNWAVYELELSAPPDMADLPKIIRLANEAAPVRCRLRRLHDDYNLKPIIWGEGPPLGEGYWGDDSGVWDEETGLKLSFRKKIGLLSESFLAGKMAAALARHIMSALVYWPGLPIWGHWHFGDTFPALRRGVRRDLVVGMSESLEPPRSFWCDSWDSRNWGRMEHPLNRRLDRLLNFSKSEFVFGSGRFGDKLQAYGGRGHLAAKKDIIWGNFRYGESNKDYEPAWVKLHELFIEQSGCAIEKVRPNDLQSAQSETRVSLATTANDRWRLGYWRLGDKNPSLRHTLQNTSRAIASESLEAPPHTWEGSWNSRPWGHPEASYWQGTWNARSWLPHPKPPLYMKLTNIGENNESGNIN